MTQLNQHCSYSGFQPKRSQSNVSFHAKAHAVDMETEIDHSYKADIFSIQCQADPITSGGDELSLTSSPDSPDVIIALGGVLAEFSEGKSMLECLRSIVKGEHFPENKNGTMCEHSSANQHNQGTTRNNLTSFPKRVNQNKLLDSESKWESESEGGYHHLDDVPVLMEKNTSQTILGMWNEGKTAFEILRILGQEDQNFSAEYSERVKCATNPGMADDVIGLQSPSAILALGALIEMFQGGLCTSDTSRGKSKKQSTLISKDGPPYDPCDDMRLFCSGKGRSSRPTPEQAEFMCPGTLMNWFDGGGDDATFTEETLLEDESYLSYDNYGSENSDGENSVSDDILGTEVGPAEGRKSQRGLGRVLSRKKKDAESQPEKSDITDDADSKTAVNKSSNVRNFFSRSSGSMDRISMNRASTRSMDENKRPSNLLTKIMRGHSSSHSVSGDISLMTGISMKSSTKSKSIPSFLRRKKDCEDDIASDKAVTLPNLPKVPVPEKPSTPILPSTETTNASANSDAPLVPKKDSPEKSGTPLFRSPMAESGGNILKRLLASDSSVITMSDLVPLDGIESKTSAGGAAANNAVKGSLHEILQEAKSSSPRRVNALQLPKKKSLRKNSSNPVNTSLAPGKLSMVGATSKRTVPRSSSLQTNSSVTNIDKNGTSEKLLPSPEDNKNIISVDSPARTKKVFDEVSTPKKGSRVAVMTATEEATTTPDRKGTRAPHKSPSSSPVKRLPTDGIGGTLSKDTVYSKAIDKPVAGLPITLRNGVDEGKDEIESLKNGMAEI